MTGSNRENGSHPPPVIFLPLQFCITFSRNAENDGGPHPTTGPAQRRDHAAALAAQALRSSADADALRRRLQEAEAEAAAARRQAESCAESAGLCAGLRAELQQATEAHEAEGGGGGATQSFPVDEFRLVRACQPNAFPVPCRGRERKLAELADKLLDKDSASRASNQLGLDKSGQARQVLSATSKNELGKLGQADFYKNSASHPTTEGPGSGARARQRGQCPAAGPVPGSGARARQRGQGPAAGPGSGSGARARQRGQGPAAGSGSGARARKRGQGPAAGPVPGSGARVRQRGQGPAAGPGSGSGAR
eukprot:gene8632-biopygen6144